MQTETTAAPKKLTVEPIMGLGRRKTTKGPLKTWLYMANKHKGGNACLSITQEENINGTRSVCELLRRMATIRDPQMKDVEYYSTTNTQSY